MIGTKLPFSHRAISDDLGTVRQKELQWAKVLRAEKRKRNGHMPSRRRLIDEWLMNYDESTK